jgi:16S rRNA (uracil1498-N3)-methyltransferase
VPPVIAECIDLPTLCALFPAGDRRVVLDPTGASVWRPRTRKGQGLILIIGPEGGFSADELDLLVQHGAERASLGRRILRFETAAIAALAIADADAHRLHAGEMELSEEPGTRS